MGEYGRRRMGPVQIHATASLLFALLIAVGALQLFHGTWTVWPLVAAWLIGVNVTAFGYYLFDKLCAQEGRRRVPEVVLHGLALAGGSVGAFLAMRLFRHKTVKGRFRVVFLAIVLLQAALLIWIMYVLWRPAA